jgi:hypothetical protein
MAAPTIASVTPSTVWTGGHLVVVRGTNFRLPPTPPASNGPLPDPLPTVRVTVDGVPATNIGVLSSTMLFCRLPEHEASRTVDKTGAVSVARFPLVVTNLDDSGVAIPGESVTKASAVVYARPDLSVEDDGGRVERAFLRLLKRQIVENVVKLGISPDFGDAPFLVTSTADPPGLVVTGPRCREDVPHWIRRAPIVVPSQLGGDMVDIKAPSATVMLEYTVSGYAKGGQQNTALMLLTKNVLQKLGFIEVDRDPADPTKGKIQYQVVMPPESEARDTSSPNESGTHSFDGILVQIRGVSLQDIASFPGQSIERVGIGTQEEFDLQMAQK